MVSKILIVDDDQAFRLLLTRLLQDEYELATAKNGEEALRLALLFDPDVILLDIIMPGIDGYEVCRRLKSDARTAGIHIIIVSAISSKEEFLLAFQAGADDYFIKPIDPNELKSRMHVYCRLQDAMRQVASLTVETKTHTAAIRQLVKRRETDVVTEQDLTVFMLAQVSESRDPETWEHLLRMRSYSQIIAANLSQEGPYAAQIDQGFMDSLHRASPLHDIGKVGISDTILLKPGLLEPDEFETIKQHTIIGASILDQAVLRSARGSFWEMAASIARFHHERFDGTGYPTGLAGTDIPLSSRIVAVADVFDALTSSRPYKPAYGAETAREIIRDQSGKHFDPVVVAAFEACYEVCVKVREQYGDQPPAFGEFMPVREHDIAAVVAREVKAS